MAGADSVEKLEDVIVRSAEQVAGQIRAAKDAISTVIFGQDRVIENTLVTILSGGHALADRRARASPRPSWSKPWASRSGSMPSASSSRRT